MRRPKLYALTATDFELPFYIDLNRRVITAAAHDIPMLAWPGGRWCLLANVYMLELYHRGLSRKNRGGTLLSYATNISPLIRYCYDNKIDFINLTDNEFTFFIKSLQGERRTKNPEVLARNTNAVIAIGRNCLDFLACVGRFYGDEEFVGPKGRIRAEQKEFVIRSEGFRKGKGKLIRKYWHHHSFPTPDPKKRRLPISTDNVRKLREAVLPCSRTIFKRKRRYVMLKLLEITGGRRSEVALLTVDSVRRAAFMPDPVLKMQTAKRPGGREDTRVLPIARHDLLILLEFIDKNRRRVVRNACGLSNDDGYVLVSETTGRKLRPNTITQELAILAKAAGIKEQSCPHLFRHRFITKLFVALIEQHKFENQDDFRRALLDTESMKQKIQQWTGHTNLSSLDRYITLAFEEITNFKKTYSIVNARRIIDSFQGSLAQFQQELRNGMSPAEASQQLLNLVDAMDSDLEKLQEAATIVQPVDTENGIAVSA